MTDTTPIAKATRISPRWFRKLGLFFLLSIGFGIYGLYDATIAYPNRGENDASYSLMSYLRAADEAHGLALPLGPPEGVSADQRRRDLNVRRQALAQTASGDGRTSRDAAAELAELRWLDALANLYRLSDERVGRDLPAEPSAARELLGRLDTEWKSRAQPKPLAGYDIPVQWIFTVVGFGLGLWLALHMGRVMSRRYTWDPEPLRLGLPGGASIVPADVVEFDKRKWDKFLFFFKIRPDHPQLGGREIKLDLYQYTPLEEWAVAMHRSARPEDYAEEQAAEASAPPESAGALPEHTS